MNSMSLSQEAYLDGLHHGEMKNYSEIVSLKTQVKDQKEQIESLKKQREEREREAQVLMDEEIVRLRNAIDMLSINNDRLRQENADLQDKNYKCNDIIEDQKRQLDYWKTLSGQLNIECFDKERKIQNLDKQIERLSSGKVPVYKPYWMSYTVQYVDKMNVGIWTDIKVADLKNLKDDNNSLKLENQKLKALIEEAKKHVGMANLMLA